MSYESDCIIVSLGSANRWDFESSVFKDLPTCRIETLDCTISKNTKPPAKIASRTTFHHVCIGSHDNVTSTGQVFMSWPSILRLVKAKEAPLHLKMDIEGYEYEVLRSIINDGSQRRSRSSCTTRPRCACCPGTIGARGRLSSPPSWNHGVPAPLRGLLPP